MSRKKRAPPRKIELDPLYHDAVVAKFINNVMKKGKKSLAQAIVYRAMERCAKKLELSNPLEGLQQAIENAKPAVEVRAKRIGGATYQIPLAIPENRRLAMAMRWIIQFGRQKSGMAMDEGLAIELADCCRNQGATIRKKENIYRMAEANKAYASYRW